MNLSEPFIRRPVATTLLAIGLLLVGLAAYRALPISNMPVVDLPTIRVSAGRPGAGPEVIASSVAAPLERRLGAIAGVRQMTSNSIQGFTSITVQFELSRSIDRAAQDVQAAINAAAADLPSDLSTRPFYRKVQPTWQPFMVLILTSPTMATTDLYDLADSVLAQRLAQIPGVAEVVATGAEQPAVRIEFDPAAISAAGLAIEQVREAVVAASASGPLGSFDGERMSETIALGGQLRSAEEYRRLVIRARDGVVLRLGDIAQVVDGVRNTRVSGTFDGGPAVQLNVQRAANANIIETVDRIQALLPELRALLPVDAKLIIMSERTGLIRASLADMQLTLALAIVLVMIVVAVFLGRTVPTLAAGLAIPLAFAGSFVGMWAFGFSINNLTLMALAISVGFVVDDAIVVIERIVERVEAGSHPLTAALDATRTLSFTVVAISLSIVAAFLPLVFIGGITGRFFQEFAVTVSVAILISMLVALSVAPMLCARRLSPGRPWRSTELLNAAFGRITSAYGRLLALALRHLWLSMLATFAALAASVWLFTSIPTAGLPEDETDMLWGWTTAAQDVSFEAMRRLQEEADAIVRRDPAVQHVTSYAGTAGAWATVNNGRFLIALKPPGERRASARRVAHRLGTAASRVPGLSASFGPVQDVRIRTQSGPSEYDFTLWGGDLALLRAAAPQVAEQLRKVPGLRDVWTDQDTAAPQINLIIDREAANRLRVKISDIGTALNNAFSQRQIATIYGERNQYRVILAAKPGHGAEAADISRLFVPAAGGRQVPLAAVATIERTLAPLSVAHRGQFAAVTIGFDIDPDRTIGAMGRDVRKALADMRLPEGVRASFAADGLTPDGGAYEQALLVIAAIVAIYILLGVLYESLVHPLTILSTLPAAGLGALLALKATGQDLSIVAIIGIILLVGIVKKNGIILVDHALTLMRTRGIGSRDAAIQAAQERLRPIVMTTLAAMLGALPFVFGEGPGSELRRPLGLTIVGGLMMAQLITLLTTPAVFVALDKTSQWIRRPIGVSAPEGNAPERAR
jgi:multidrug efflux pump